MNELSTTIYKLDLDYIIKNYLDKRMWKKVWTLYDYNGVVVRANLYSIEVHNNSVAIRIKADGGYFWDSTIVSVKLDNSNKETFNQSVFSAIKRCIRQAEENVIKASGIYRQAVELDTENGEENEKEAIEILDREEVVNPDIREAYIGAYQGSKETNNASKILDASIYRFTPNNYLMLAYLMENITPKYSLGLISEVKQYMASTQLDQLTKIIKEGLGEIDIAEMEDEDED